jgi:hypothetical protein
MPVLVFVGRPEARGIRRQHLVDQVQPPAASRPNSNLVSAMMMPRAAAYSAPRIRTARRRNRRAPARRDRRRRSWPPRCVEADVLVVLAHSALVAGVKIGCGSFCACCRPAGSAMPQTRAAAAGSPSSPSRSGSRAPPPRPAAASAALHHDGAAAHLRCCALGLGSEGHAIPGRCRSGGWARCGVRGARTRSSMQSGKLRQHAFGPCPGSGRQDDVEGRQAVGGDDQHPRSPPRRRRCRAPCRAASPSARSKPPGP